MPTLMEHCTASQTERKPSPALGQNPLIPPPTSHVAFCVWPICPATRSTGLAGMKQSFGAKRARSCLLSMHCIVANHKRGRRFRIGSRQDLPADGRDDY